MKRSPAEEFSDDGPVTWDDVAALQAQLKETARAMLAREGNAGTVHTTQLLNSALKKLNPQSRDWREVSWENREAFFKDAFFAMRRVLVSYSRPRHRRNVKVGGFESEHVNPLVEAGALNLDRLVDHAAEGAELAEAVDRALAELDALYPGKHLAEIVQHRVFSGLTRREIARMLGINAETVSARLDLALASSLGQPVSLMDLSAGDVVGKFTLLELLSSGSYGDVWKAAQAIDGGANAIRALKFIRPEILFAADTRQHHIANFQRECEHLSTIQHDHIVTFIDTGVVPLGFAKDDVPFLVMQYRESSPLWPAPALPSAAWTRVEFMRGVCDAIECIHGHALLHRDLSPNNVRVLTNGTPIVIDFGLAAEMRPERAFQPELMRPATPLYTAPEQLAGRGEIGRPTDVHALGLLLFQLLTDKLPYHLTGPAGTLDPRELDDAICTQQRLPLKEFRSDLPGIESILAKALELRPQDRYQTAADLRDALGTWLKESSTAPAAVTNNISITKSVGGDQITIHQSVGKGVIGPVQGDVHFH